MQVAIEVGPSSLRVTPLLPPVLLKTIQEETKFRMLGYEYTEACQQRGWDGYITNFKRNQTAPSGLYYRIQRILKKSGHDVKLVYLCDYPPIGSSKIHGLTLADFQSEMVDAAIKYRICVLSAPVRSGKTAVISSITNRIKQYPVCVVTNYRDLARQTQSDIIEHTQKPVGVLSESKFEAGDVWVTNYAALNAVARWQDRGRKSSVQINERNVQILDLIRRTKVLLLDECHYALAKKFRKVLGLFNNIGYKIGLSGTPRDTARVSAVELETVIGPVVKRIKVGKLIESGRLSKPKVLLYDLPQEWYDFDLRYFQDIYTCNIVNNTNRNLFISEIVRQFYTRGKSSYGMVRWKEHGRLLRELITNSFFVWGGIKTDDRFNLYNALQLKNLACIIATVGKVGLNLPKLDGIINAEGLYSNISTVQKMRSLTACEGKKYGYIIDFIDKGPYLFSHSQTRLKIYQGLDGFDIKIIKIPQDFFGRGIHEGQVAA